MEVWKEGIIAKQIIAAEHIGSHARLLAGPGTGKSETMTRRILALIVKHGVNPSEILVLTFTRVAAYELKRKVKNVLDPLKKDLPHISTLHSFALQQLMRNSKIVDTLPKPLRIADDYEERHIIQEELKEDLQAYIGSLPGGKSNFIGKIQELFQKLSADWETLRIESGERICGDAKFIGAWSQQRKQYGYTLRGELVYQLKRALNQVAAFDLGSNYKHLLIDEYQDLNACDLAIVEELSKRGAELFVAGDDDQSIYGFRYADPTGIRVFSDKYGATKLDLDICYRCDKDILQIGEFVADLDYMRLPKSTRPKDGALDGEVHLYCYKDQYHEARDIALKCKEMIGKHEKYEILILLRSDYKGKFSSVLKEELIKESIPVAVETDISPLECNDGRCVLAIFKLMGDPFDGLAWRTLLGLTNGIGIATIKLIRDVAMREGKNFAEAIVLIENNPSLIGKQKLLMERIGEIRTCLNKIKLFGDPLPNLVPKIVAEVVKDQGQFDLITNHLQQVIVESSAKSIEGLLQEFSASVDSAEQELEVGKVNILTMHKAKGLSADAVFIVGAEKQFIPGKNVGNSAEDERRLLYVSLTRAKHDLYITFCQERISLQTFTGSESGNPGERTRSLRGDRSEIGGNSQFKCV